MDLLNADRKAALGLFVLVFLTHSISPNATSADSVWTVPQMMSMLSHGDTSLDEYSREMKEQHYRAVQCVDAACVVTAPDPVNGCAAARSYGHYPIGVSVVAFPVFVAMDASLRICGSTIWSLLEHYYSSAVIKAFFQRDYLASYGEVEVVIASFLIGIATAVMFLTFRQYVPRTQAILLALLFAYGTAAWSTGSRALWQHGPAMLLLSIALYFLARRRANSPLVAWTAVPLAMAYFVRPATAIVIAAVAVYVLRHYRSRFLQWCLLAVLTAAPFLIYNFAIYHRMLQPYFLDQGFLPLSAGSVLRFLGALAGQCISPSRGLLVFSPFFIFSVAGVWLAIRRKWETPLAFYLAVAIALHWMAISAFADWTAGFCFGPRYFAEITPLLMFFLIPVLQEYAKRGKPKLAVAGFTLCVGIAVFIHSRGALVWAVEEWNQPDVNPARVWDWKDPQFLRGLLKKPTSHAVDLRTHLQAHTWQDHQQGQ